MPFHFGIFNPMTRVGTLRESPPHLTRFPLSGWNTRNQAMNDQSKRWVAAIAGMVEIPVHAMLPHQVVGPVRTLGTNSTCWQIQLADGTVGWAIAGDLDPERPTFYLPPEVGNECLLREAASLGRGSNWAEQEQHWDCGRARREMCRAILEASPERRWQLDDQIAVRILREGPIRGITSEGFR